MARSTLTASESSRVSDATDASDDVLAALQEHLQRAEIELRERGARAHAEDVPPQVLLALAAEGDKLALERDIIADAQDENATARDRVALSRDVVGSSRDRRARGLQQDLDPGALDRSASGSDRDLAAGDRGDSFDDRGRAHEARQRAATDREHAAEDRAEAGRKAQEQTKALEGLRAALESRLVIGQAEGLLMARYNLAPDAAFHVLVRLSQERNIKLRDVAAALITAQAEGGTGASAAQG